MTPNINRKELVKFLEILQTKLQKHQKAYDGFLIQIQKPIEAILYSYVNEKSELEPASEQKATFNFRP